MRLDYEKLSQKYYFSTFKESVNPDKDYIHNNNNNKVFNLK
jgi:hypothetical protein